MDCHSFFRSIIRVIIDVFGSIVFILVFTFIPGLPPHMEFESYSLTPPLPLEGALALNNKLNDAEKLFVNEIQGPEHLEVYNDVLYTTLSGGYVVKIMGDNSSNIEPVVKFGKKCDGLYNPELCGRPLGLSFDDKGYMYVADGYYGIYKVNVTTGEYEQLVSIDTEIDGKAPRLPNSVSVAQDGSVYWTDSSTTHFLHDIVYTILGNGNGRLIKYDPKTKTNTVLIDNIHFANGVALSRDESFVLVSDLFRARILRYNLRGPKEGQTEVFLDGLPGYPDNLHSDKKGEFYVTLPIGVDKDNKGVTALLGPYPYIRRLIARLLYFLEFPALQLESIYPNYYSKMFSQWVGSGAMIPSSIMSSRTTVVFFNEDGTITRSRHCTDGKINFISDIAYYKDAYYLGSFSNPYLARVKAR